MLLLLETLQFLLGLIEENQTDFNDLGKLLLVGVAAAIVFAVGFTLLRFKLREKSPQTSDFISISSTQEENQRTGR